jgi:tRNA-specific 2-thiouridylase
MAYYPFMHIRQARGKSVYVALSGGVDSSVSAALLVRRGARVTAVFMKPWQPPELGAAGCLWERDRADALAVAAHLGIPLETWDVSSEYERLVADPMISGYRSGMTPNPDVACNRHIKFGLFAARAQAAGAELIATGHYARVVRDKGDLYVARGTDPDKDQSYFLYDVPTSVLPRVLFPVGDMLKRDVRALAIRMKLPNAAKKDSQGVCFVGQLDMAEFLRMRITAKRGMIVHLDGRVLGEHDGAMFYTIGQRHGLDLKDGGGPYYVVATDIVTNSVTVGPESALMTRTIRVRDMAWHGPRPPASARLTAQIRYRTAAVGVSIGRAGMLHFSRPVRAAAPGQSVVFYRGQRVVGGAIIR